MRIPYGKINKRFLDEAIEILKHGGIGVMPTDTIYGLCGSALSRKAVVRIYKARHRHAKKPMIILIGSQNDLKRFGIEVDKKIRKILKRFWPGEISVIFSCPFQKFFYLHRGIKSLAFRLPKPHWLRKFLEKSGPLVAPSANLEDLPPAKTITEAKKYFGKTVDFYVDAGKAIGKPSKLIKIEKGGKIVLLRK